MAPDKEKIDDRPSCGGGIKTREIAARAQTIALENREAIEKLKNRLPVWATIVFGLLTFALGWSLNYALTMSRLIK